MSGYRAHLIGGAVLYGITLYALRSHCNSVFIAAEWLMFAFAGSLFPDVDTKSKGQKLLYKFLFIILIILAVQRKFLPMAMLSIVAIIPLIVRHRGLFHKFWFVIGLPTFIGAVIALYAPAYAKTIGFDILFFIAGTISHLFLDFVVQR